jgi:hypothetical protein
MPRGPSIARWGLSALNASFRVRAQPAERRAGRRRRQVGGRASARSSTHGISPATCPAARQHPAEVVGLVNGRESRSRVGQEQQRARLRRRGPAEGPRGSRDVGPAKLSRSTSLPWRSDPSAGARRQRASRQPDATEPLRALIAVPPIAWTAAGVPPSPAGSIGRGRCRPPAATNRALLHQPGRAAGSREPGGLPLPGPGCR